MKKIILLDIDYTLSNRDYLRNFGRNYLANASNLSLEKLNPLVDEIIRKSWQKYGIFDIYFYSKQMSKKLKKRELEKILLDMFLIHYPYDKALYPEVQTVVEELRNRYVLGIQSDGQEAFQLKKIEPIEQAFDKHYIFIFKNKQEEIFEKIKAFQNDVICVDDKPSHVNKLLHAGIRGILINHGHWAKEYFDKPEQYPYIKETINDLSELVSKCGL